MDRPTDRIDQEQQRSFVIKKFLVRHHALEPIFADDLKHGRISADIRIHKTCRAGKYGDQRKAHRHERDMEKYRLPCKNFFTAREYVLEHIIVPFELNFP